MSRRTKRTLILGLSVFGALLLAMTSRVNVAQAIPSVSVAGPPAIQCGSGGTFSAVIRDGLVPVIGATVTFSSSQPGAFFPANIVTNAAGTAATLFVPSVATFGATATVSAGASGGIPVATGQVGSTNVTILCGAAPAFCNPAVQSCFNTCLAGTFVSSLSCGNPCISGTFLSGVNCSTSCFSGTFFNSAGCVNQCGIAGFNNCVTGCQVGSFVSGFNTACNVLAPATQISVTAPSAATCGSAVTVTALLRNSFGLAVPSGAVATFSSTLGQISATGVSSGGTASAVLTLPTRTQGAAVVNVTSGSATGSAAIAVSCPVAAGPVTAAPVAIAPALPAQIVQAVPAAAPIIRLPSTGDAGLADPNYVGNHN